MAMELDMVVAMDKKQLANFTAKYDIDPENGCWVWTAATLGPQKRACFWMKDLGRMANACRVSYEHYKGDPAGKVVCHACDNPKCVNPDHMFLGTQKDNVRDCIRKGRFPDRRAESNGRAKLNWQLVDYIRESSATNVALAKELGVTDVVISNVRRGKSWVRPEEDDV